MFVHSEFGTRFGHYIPREDKAINKELKPIVVP